MMFKIVVSHEGVATVFNGIVKSTTNQYSQVDGKDKADKFTPEQVYRFLKWLETSNWPPYEIILFRI